MEFFYNVTLNVNIEFLKTAKSEPIVYRARVIMRFIEIRTQRILNNLIKQNQKLASDFVKIVNDNVQCQEPSVQSVASNV